MSAFWADWADDGRMNEGIRPTKKSAIPYLYLSFWSYGRIKKKGSLYPTPSIEYARRAPPLRHMEAKFRLIRPKPKITIKQDFSMSYGWSDGLCRIRPYYLEWRKTGRKSSRPLPGQPGVQRPSPCRFIPSEALTAHLLSWAIPAGNKARRWLMLDVSEGA